MERRGLDGLPRTDTQGGLVTVRASVVVPTYNRAESLTRLLVALESQRLPRDEFEIVVVDDGSTDRTEEVLRARPHVLATRQRNQGPAMARNSGVDRSTGALIVFVDDDCVPEEDWLQRLIDADDEAGPDVAGFGGRIDPLRHGFLADFVQAERLVDHSPLAGHPTTLRYLVTANAAFRRDAFCAVGGFDPAYRTAAGEDVDLSFRIRALGHRLIPAPKAKVLHAHPTSLRRLLRVYRRGGAARTRLASRHADLSVQAGTRTLLSPRAWQRRIADYRNAGAPRRRIPVYLLLRSLCLAAFLWGVVEAKVAEK
jgi:GT2 family glycosyltransferase